MKNNVTIKDVARLAGVSISTVSRVINDSKPVTDEVKQRVLDVIKETGYVPNPLARSLVTKKSKLIGVIIPEVSDSFVNEILNGVEAISKMYDYDILLVNTYSDKEQELDSIRLLKTKQVEGIVMVSWILDEDHVNCMKESRIPAVYISKTARDFDLYTVSTSNENASYDMTKYLIENGHKDIAFIMTSIDETILEKERRSGYERALKDNNIEIKSELIKHGNTDYEGGYNSMKELLDNNIIPSAAFVTGDEAAVGAINAIFDAGYSVPEDISVAGFNDTKLAKIYRPKLTTVFQPLFDMGAVSIRALIKLINGEELEDKKIELPYQIMERESVAKKK
ncbi:LacI family DNA-binding transcriptional regulator [Terrisporobacter sp.]|uniref:LacI family DNA-binding transcriptional regulator n=1 Tax=Terrisporobacter sp. TaxID=1965305 RepID=UPI002634BE7C|nr:LacI family DNA-binding transcriptional regulator [Terrisporobacter sp.]